MQTKVIAMSKPTVLKRVSAQISKLFKVRLMLPAWLTDYSVPEFLTRGFENLDSVCYGGALSSDIQNRLQAGPVKALFIGVGRGREAIEAKQKFGANLQLTAINKKSGEFFSERGYKGWALRNKVKLSKSDIDAYRKVRDNLMILDIETQLTNLNDKFDLIIFGWGVSEYLWDCVTQYDDLSANKMNPNGTMYTMFNSLVLVDEDGERIEWTYHWLQRQPVDAPIKLVNRGTSIRAGTKMPFVHHSSVHEQDPEHAIPNVLSKYMLQD